MLLNQPFYCHQFTDEKSKVRKVIIPKFDNNYVAEVGFELGQSDLLFQQHSNNVGEAQYSLREV